MRLKLCVNPLKRTFGGRLPFKRTPKDKTRKQMQRMKQRLEALEMQVSGYFHINKQLMHELTQQEDLIADQEDLIADVLHQALDHVEDVLDADCYEA